MRGSACSRITGHSFSQGLIFPCFPCLRRVKPGTRRGFDRQYPAVPLDTRDILALKVGDTMDDVQRHAAATGMGLSGPDDSEEELRQKITELERQVQELLAQIASLQKDLVDWHSAMFAALRLILKPYRDNLIMEREHPLNMMPTRIDCLVVKIDKRIPIDMDAFRLFRKYNVIELKSYEDKLDEDVLWHTIGYAAQYKSLEEHLGDIPIDEVTITIFRSSFPRALFEKLEGSGWRIEERYHNIFYLSGKIDIPIQIVVANELGSEYLPLEILTGRAKEADVRRFAAFQEGLTEKGDADDAAAVMQACAEGNRELFQKIWEDERMQGVLRELMKDDFIRERQEGAASAYNTVAERLIRSGTNGSVIETATGYDRSQIDSIARGMKMSVAWNEASA